MSHVKKSLELFESKFNCAQAVFASFSEDLGLDEKQALKIGGCFGSGMRKGEVCGACTGALMAKVKLGILAAKLSLMMHVLNFWKNLNP